MEKIYTVGREGQAAIPSHEEKSLSSLSSPSFGKQVPPQGEARAC
jgi:hypothetical protein